MKRFVTGGEDSRVRTPTFLVEYPHDPTVRAMAAQPPTRSMRRADRKRRISRRSWQSSETIVFVSDGFEQIRRERRRRAKFECSRRRDRRTGPHPLHFCRSWIMIAERPILTSAKGQIIRGDVVKGNRSGNELRVAAAGGGIRISRRTATDPICRHPAFGRIPASQPQNRRNHEFSDPS